MVGRTLIGMAVTRSADLTLRFRNPANRDLLRFVAEQRHESMNSVAERAIELQLKAEAVVIERDLVATLEWLRQYDVDADMDAAADRFAQAEVSHDDPLVSTRAAVADPLGLTRHFV